MKSNRTYIALVDTFCQLRPSDYQTPEIRVTVAVLGKGKDGADYPNNWSLDYDEPKNSTGGCFARVYASQYDAARVVHHFSCYGPAISYGNGRDYEHAARALKRIGSAMEEMRSTRGDTDDAATLMGRWLEATGIKAVWMRPEGKRDTGWLNEGHWDTLTIGSFVNLVRSKYFAPESANDNTAAA